MEQNKQEYWQRQISLCRESGKSPKDYCRENKLSYWNYMCWKRKLHNTPEPSSPLIRVTVNNDPKTSSGTTDIELVVAEKFVLRIGHDYHSETLKRLLHDLGGSQ